MDNGYNRHNRRKYSLKVHIVLVAKYQKQLLIGAIDANVKQRIFDICSFNGWDIIAMETDKDYIHFLTSSRKSPASKPPRRKRWVGTSLFQWECRLPLKSCDSSYEVRSK